MQLDKVITVAIGRNSGDNVPLTKSRWDVFRRKIKLALSEHGTLVAATSGRGVGSDDEREAQPEDTAVFVAINCDDIATLRAKVAGILRGYGQSSAAFAHDTAHEPVFNTLDGSRA